MADKQKTLEMQLWKPEEGRIMGIAERLGANKLRTPKLDLLPELDKNIIIQLVAPEVRLQWMEV